MDTSKLYKQIENNANKIKKMIDTKYARGDKLVMLFKKDFSPFSNGKSVIFKFATKEEVKTNLYII